MKILPNEEIPEFVKGKKYPNNIKLLKYFQSKGINTSGFQCNAPHVYYGIIDNVFAYYTLDVIKICCKNYKIIELT